MWAPAWRRLSHRDGLHDDANPRRGACRSGRLMAIAGAAAHVGRCFWPCLVAFGRQCGLRPPRRPQRHASRCGSQVRQTAAHRIVMQVAAIDRVVRPDDAQRAKLQALQSAASQAADTIKAACPADVPPTPLARLTAVGQRLGAMLQGVETMQPALADFYNSLADAQKARFNSMGRQLFAQKNATNE